MFFTACENNIYIDAYYKTVEMLVSVSNEEVGSATGFYISKNRILTNFHLINNFELNEISLYCVPMKTMQGCR